MRRKKGLTMIGVVLNALLLVLIGLLPLLTGGCRQSAREEMPQKPIAKETQVFLERSGKPAETQKPVEDEMQAPSYAQIEAYLKDWNTDWEEQEIREPMETEYDMETAVARAREGVRALIKKGALPQTDIENAIFESAYFESKTVDGRERGRWLVWFSAAEPPVDDANHIAVMLDAVTGFIMQYTVDVAPFDDIKPYQQMLLRFAEYYGVLHESGETSVQDMDVQGSRLPWGIIRAGNVRAWFDVFEMGFKTQVDFYLDYWN